MNNKSYLATILPHKEPMILIDDIIEYSLENKYLVACVTIRENELFYDKDLNGIDSAVGIEYMAQTIGCYAYFKNECKKPEIGYLLGTRLYNNAIKVFEKDKTYYIKVMEVFVAEIYSFECFIYNEKGEEIASATVNVYRENDKSEKETSND